MGKGMAGSGCGRRERKIGKRVSVQGLLLTERTWQTELEDLAGPPVVARWRGFNPAGFGASAYV